MEHKPKTATWVRFFGHENIASLSSLHQDGKIKIRSEVTTVLLSILSAYAVEKNNTNIVYFISPGRGDEIMPSKFDVLPFYQKMNQKVMEASALVNLLKSAKQITFGQCGDSLFAKNGKRTSISGKS